jgi:polyferredoxin
MASSKHKLDTPRIIFILISTIIAVHISIVGQPLIQANAQAINILVTVFSILGGFLIAVMSIVGIADEFTETGSWRRKELYRETFERKLTRYYLLFIFYLLTLGLIFASSLLCKVDGVKINKYIEHLYLFTGTFSFILSFALPGSLRRMYMKRYDQRIEEMKENGPS